MQVAFIKLIMECSNKILSSVAENHVLLQSILSGHLRWCLTKVL